MHPESAELGDTVVAYRQPLRDDWSMDTLVCIRLSQQSQAEGTEVGPEKEVEGMKGVCSSTSMLLIILSPKLSLRGELHTTIIEKSIMVDGGVILQRGYMIIKWL